MGRDRTDEFSFVLGPSPYGVGVFAVCEIRNGAFLRLFGDEGTALEERTRIMNAANVPEFFQKYCMFRERALICPPDFGAMPIGWYVNHSRIPNAVHSDYQWYAARDIKAGEEIFIDYNTLGEPEFAKDDYY